MPGISGIDYIKSKGKNSAKGLVFITTSLDYGIEAYKLNAVHYLVKPLKVEDVFEALNRYFVKLAKEDDKYFIINSSTKILYKSVIYIESINKRCIIHTDIL